MSPGLEADLQPQRSEARRPEKAISNKTSDWRRQQRGIKASGALTAAVVLDDGDGNDGLPTHRACCAKPGMEDMGAVWPRYSARRKAE
ncbi:hypothetical protein GGP41_010574 [Bipolaris sorokiniana]|uniref:Uncharacterized protein n=1 Tax=Cochliobolus sativus TaxID=45130 RepID=A0A8H5ZIM5_COCSA|nr:hypothetical protein GGP41_010574 [Bipolaris sorokiniana]